MNMSKESQNKFNCTKYILKTVTPKRVSIENAQSCCSDTQNLDLSALIIKTDLDAVFKSANFILFYKTGNFKTFVKLAVNNLVHLSLHQQQPLLKGKHNLIERKSLSKLKTGRHLGSAPSSQKRSKCVCVIRPMWSHRTGSRPSVVCSSLPPPLCFVYTPSSQLEWGCSATLRWPEPPYIHVDKNRCECTP